MNAIEQVLELARWAPSGDNAQPWRFEVLGPEYAVIHAFDTREHCLYDLRGEASQLAVGAMLETARIAATQQSYETVVTRDQAAPAERPRFDLRLVSRAGLEADPLLPFITTRCTNRRAFSARPLQPKQKEALEKAVGKGFELRWLEGKAKRAAAWLMFRSAYIRLSIREGYDTHKAVIDWDSRFSQTGLPDKAIGMDPIGLALMRWAMADWARLRFFSRYLGGTLLPRFQLELLPGLCSAGYPLILAPTEPEGIDQRLAAGAAVQRFWLTAASLDLQFQPCITPLIFSRYHRLGVEFSQDANALRRAGEVQRDLDRLIGTDAQRVVWMGRIGAGRPPEARSLRKPLKDLRLGVG